MLERRKQEAELVKARYGEIEVGSNFEWIIIRRYPLPSGWNRSEVALLVLIRPGYPTTPPDNFFVDNDLRLVNGQVPGNASPNQTQLGRPWLQFSYHVDGAGWKPHPDLLKGHNLLTFLLGAEKRLSEVN